LPPGVRNLIKKGVSMEKEKRTMKKLTINEKLLITLRIALREEDDKLLDKIAVLLQRKAKSIRNVKEIIN